MGEAEFDAKKNGPLLPKVTHVNGAAVSPGRASIVPRRYCTVTWRLRGVTAPLLETATGTAMVEIWKRIFVIRPHGGSV